MTSQEWNADGKASRVKIPRQLCQRLRCVPTSVDEQYAGRARSVQFDWRCSDDHSVGIDRTPPSLASFQKARVGCPSHHGACEERERGKHVSISVARDRGIDLSTPPVDAARQIAGAKPLGPEPLGGHAAAHAGVTVHDELLRSVE